MMINDGIYKNDNKIISFLMIGQSNMAGRGELKDVEPIENKMCYMLRMGRWQPMSEPVNPDRDIFTIRFHSGISLAASFADEVAKFTKKEVGLIPCADGGTKISQWQPGGILFDHAVMMTKLAMRTSELGGIIWHQGESDCRDFDKQQYCAHFLNFMTELRKELNAEQLPLIIGEISREISDEWNLGDGPQKMNQLLHELKNEIPCCEVACVDGLELKEDGLHFNSVACRELGRRYFQKYKELISCI